jgi:preprotein translocase subunit YajC
MLAFWAIPLQGGGSGSFLGNQLVLMLIIFAVFYLIVIRPMRRKQQETEAMLGKLKSGDQVLTTGGIYGTVVGVNEDRVQLRIADQVKIQVQKSAVTQLVQESGKRA